MRKIVILIAYSRKLLAFVLKMKDQVLSVFKEFQSKAEKESGLKLKAVWTDHFHFFHDVAPNISLPMLTKY